MAEFNCKFEVGQIVATKKNVERWAGGGVGSPFAGEILSIGFHSDGCRLSVTGGYNGLENDFVSISEANEYAIQYLADRIKKISLMGKIS